MSIGGPAFPVPELVVEGQLRPSDNAGMSLRDYFAAAALPGIIATYKPTPMYSPADAAKSAYVWADALIRARG